MTETILPLTSPSRSKSSKKFNPPKLSGSKLSLPKLTLPKRGSDPADPSDPSDLTGPTGPSDPTGPTGPTGPTEPSGHRKAPSSKMPSRPIIIAAAVALVVAIAGGAYELTKSNSSSPAPLAPVVATHLTKPVVKTPLESLLARVTANALAQKSVHVAVKDTSAKQGTAIFSDDDAVTGGIQRIAIYGGHVVARVVGPTTYFTGDRRGLIKFLGLSTAQAAQVRGHWVALTKGQVGYASVTEGITLASAMKEDGLTGPLRRLPVRVRHGQRVFGIRGTPTGDGAPRRLRATLWVSVRGQLPVEFDQIAPHNSSITRLSRWGKPVRVTAPSRVIGETSASSGGTLSS